MPDRDTTPVFPRPVCDCHGEPQRWQNDKRMRLGGYWYCAVRARETDAARRRRRGIPALGSPEYLGAVRVREPAYRTCHHRARKALRGQPCAHCGITEKLQAALRHDGSPSRRRLSPEGLSYSISEADYLSLCSQCHADYDGVAERVRKWHAARIA